MSEKKTNDNEDLIELKNKRESQSKKTKKNHEKDFSKPVSKEINNIFDSQFLSTDSLRDKTKIITSPNIFTVHLSWKPYKRIVGYAIRYANDNIDKKDWCEVYGILIGKIEENKRIIVKDAIPLVKGGRTGVELEPIHYVDLSQIDSSIYERDIENKKTDFIIGWWHTHPGFGFFFSPVDRETQLGYQIPNPFAIGLVFDHTERTSNFLGIRALRLMDLDRGITSDYDIVELRYDQDKKKINHKINKIIEKITENMEKGLKELEEIENLLLKKTLPQLQKKFGLILGPKRDIKVILDEQDAKMDENKFYTWYPEAFTKKYRKPKFRLKLEAEIEKSKAILKDLREKNQPVKYQESKVKFQKKIKEMISKPNKLINKIMSDFGKKIELIYPIYDYLDTNERKTIEHFEEWISEYFKVLDKFKITIANF